MNNDMRGAGDGLRFRASRALVSVRAAALAILLAALTMPLAACVDVVGVGHRDLEILWPRNGEVLHDYETFEARVRGLDLDDYEIWWYVDDSREYRMHNDWRARPPRKFVDVDTWDWYWYGTGPYTVGFIAEDRRGRQIAHRTVRVYVR